MLKMFSAIHHLSFVVLASLLSAPALFADITQDSSDCTWQFIGSTDSSWANAANWQTRTTNTAPWTQATSYPYQGGVIPTGAILVDGNEVQSAKNLSADFPLAATNLKLRIVNGAMVTLANLTSLAGTTPADQPNIYIDAISQITLSGGDISNVSNSATWTIDNPVGLRFEQTRAPSTTCAYSLGEAGRIYINAENVAPVSISCSLPNAVTAGFPQSQKRIVTRTLLQAKSLTADTFTATVTTSTADTTDNEPAAKFKATTPTTDDPINTYTFVKANGALKLIFVTNSIPPAANLAWLFKGISGDWTDARNWSRWDDRNIYNDTTFVPALDTDSFANESAILTPAFGKIFLNSVDDAITAPALNGHNLHLTVRDCLAGITFDTISALDGTLELINTPFTATTISIEDTAVLTATSPSATIQTLSAPDKTWSLNLAIAGKLTIANTANLSSNTLTLAAHLAMDANAPTPITTRILVDGSDATTFNTTGLTITPTFTAGYSNEKTLKQVSSAAAVTNEGDYFVAIVGKQIIVTYKPFHSLPLNVLSPEKPLVDFSTLSTDNAGKLFRDLDALYAGWAKLYQANLPSGHETIDKSKFVKDPDTQKVLLALDTGDTGFLTMPIYQSDKQATPLNGWTTESTATSVTNSVELKTTLVLSDALPNLTDLYNNIKMPDVTDPSSNMAKIALCVKGIDKRIYISRTKYLDKDGFPSYTADMADTGYTVQGDLNALHTIRIVNKTQSNSSAFKVYLDGQCITDKIGYKQDESNNIWDYTPGSGDWVLSLFYMNTAADIDSVNQLSGIGFSATEGAHLQSLALLVNDVPPTHPALPEAFKDQGITADDADFGRWCADNGYTASTALSDDDLQAFLLNAPIGTSATLRITGLSVNETTKLSTLNVIATPTGPGAKTFDLSKINATICLASKFKLTDTWLGALHYNTAPYTTVINSTTQTATIIIPYDADLKGLFIKAILVSKPKTTSYTPTL